MIKSRLLFAHSQRVGKLARRAVGIRQQSKLICWKSVKTIEPQRKDEIRLGVKVSKAEKIYCMA